MTAADRTQSDADREIVITRLIDAPLARVWRAWADPKEIVQWWGPHGFNTDTDRREFKQGGMWKHTMVGPDGARYPNAAKYEEIVEGERIVYTNGGGREGDNKGVHFRAVVTFVAKGDKTELTHAQRLRHARRARPGRARVRRHRGRQADAVTPRGAHRGRLPGLAPGRRAAREGVAVLDRAGAPRRLVRAEGLRDGRARSSISGRAASTTTACAATASTCGASGRSRKSTRAGKLVFINAFSDKDGGLGRHPLAPTWPAQMMTTVLFADFGPKTLITIQWSPYEADEVERKTFSEGMASMQQGWGGTFERLDAYLKENR